MNPQSRSTYETDFSVQAIGAISAKVDGTPRKLLDVSRLAQLGWKASISLADGIRSTYAEYLSQNQ